MVSTRKAPRSATPPAMPSIDDTPASTSKSSSNKKMSREMQRLMIDANPSLGGASSPGSSRRSNKMTVPPSPPASHTTSSPAKDRTDSTATSPKKLPLPDTLTVQDDLDLTRLPSPAADKPLAQAITAMQSTSISVTADPPSTVDLITTRSPDKRTGTPRGVKRTINDYFGKTAIKSPAEKPAKRRKIQEPIKIPQVQDLDTAQVEETNTPHPQDTPTAPPQEAEQTKTQHDTPPVLDLPQALSPPPAPAPSPPPIQSEPEASTLPTPSPSQQTTSNDEEEIAPEPSAEQTTTMTTQDLEITQPEPDQPSTAQPAPPKVSREMRRLQIDANPQILGSTEPQDAHTRKRKRGSDTTALSANITAPPAPPKRVRRSSPPIDPSSLIPKPFVLADPAINRARPRILPSGDVNPVWLDGVLAHIADVCGDEETRDKILAEAAADTLVQSDAQKARRMLEDARVIKEWPLLSLEETVLLKEEREGMEME